MEKKAQAAVCFFCHDGQGKYLLAKRSPNDDNEPGTWSPGAGGVEYGEHVEEALRREIREEYAADTIDFEFLGHRDWINSSGVHLFIFDYRVRVDPASVINNEPHQIAELRWITIPELDSFKEPFHPQMSVFMDMHRPKLI